MIEPVKSFSSRVCRRKRIAALASARRVGYNVKIATLGKPFQHPPQQYALIPMSAGQTQRPSQSLMPTSVLAFVVADLHMATACTEQLNR